MRRSLVTLATALVLWAVIAELNHALSGAHLYVFVGGLFIAYAALSFPLRSGILTSFVIGLICDAAVPVHFGTFGLLFATAHAIVFNLRRRIPRDDTLATVLVALFANLGLYLSLCFVETINAPSVAGAWPRILMDLAVSQVCLALIAPWFLSLQRQSLALLGLTPDRNF